MAYMYIVIAAYGNEACSWTENMCVTASAEKAQSIVDDLELAVMWANEKMPMLYDRKHALLEKSIGGKYITPTSQLAIDLIAYAVELGAGENELKILNIDINNAHGALIWARTDAAFSYEQIEVV